MSGAPQTATQAAPQQSRSNSSQSSFGSRFSAGVGNFMMNSPPVLHEKRGLALLFLMLMYAAIHYYIDYSFFGFQNNIVRTIMHAAFATVAINVLMSGRQGTQKGTVVAIWKIFIYAFFFSIGVYTIAPDWLVSNGGAEIILGVFLFLSVGVFPKLYAKDQNFDSGILRVYIFTAYLLPFIAQGVFLQLFSSGVLTSSVPQLQHILVNYVTPMFLPIWLYYLAFFQDYIEKPFWFVILLISLILLFSSPLWIDYYNGGIAALGTSGVNEAQKSAAVTYIGDVGTAAYTFTRERWNATTTAASCWWYSMSGQLNSLTGKAAEDPKYAMCNPQSGNEVSEFEASVERGALSSASMTLGTITAAQQKYFQSQPATFLAPFKAQSFDTSLAVKPVCTFALISDTQSTTDVAPTTKPFTISGSDQQDIICTIPAGKLVAGKSYQFVSSVSFDYITSAYITRYFTTPDALSSFRSGSMSASDNLLSFYAISDKQPISRSTKGPTKVGINAGSGLIVLSAKNDPNPEEFTVVVTVENQKSWTGKMNEVKLILLALPRGVELKERTTLIDEPKPPANGPLSPNASWSNYDCTSGAFTGNFAKLPEDVCSSVTSLNSDLSSFNDLDCAHYNYYYLRPGYGTGKTAIAVADGAESTQKPFVSCQAIANDASQLFAKNANFATKSIQARVKYTYQLQQSRSFKVEPLAPGEKPYLADKVLSERQLCTAPNAYADSFTPNLALLFFQDGKQETSTTNTALTLYKSVSTAFDSLPDSEKTALKSDCFTQSVATAIAMKDWQTVQGNPMTPGYNYGYLSANKKMIEYLQAQETADNSIPSKTDVRYTDATQLDAYLKANNVAVATKYLNALSFSCKTSAGGTVDWGCVIGKYKCGVNYLPGNYNQCTVSNCEYCEKTTTTDILTYATQVGQAVGVN